MEESTTYIDIEPNTKRQEAIDALFGDNIAKGVQEEVEKIMKYGMRNTKRHILRLGLHKSILERSIFWRAWSEAGGSREIFEVRALAYCKFVELALGRSYKLTQLEEVAKPNWGPIYRPDGGKRMAKPFLMIELRRQARRFQRWLEKNYGFKGYCAMLAAVEDLEF